MSPWNQSRRRMWPVYAGIALIVLGFVMGYLLLTGVIGTPDDDGSEASPAGVVPPRTHPTKDEDGTDRQPHLRVLSWGRESGQLAVVVRNESRHFIERARVRITARDTGDVVVLSTTGTPADVCCTILGLPPGEEFGLFAEVDDDVPDIGSVVVEPVAAETHPVDADERVTVATPRLQRYDDDTVVTATVTARGRLSGYLAVQALLTDGEGVLAQVISGRFYCFEPGRARQVRLHLFHAVPGDLRLSRVVAYPIPAGVPANVPGRCR